MSNSSQVRSSFYALNRKVQKWFYDQGWGALNTLQENSIPLILAHNSDVIISAPTSAGKTEAVFLPVLTYLLNHEEEEGYKVLYISPLKALINDQYDRLSDMTNHLSVKITPWHGEASVSRKNKSIKSPEGILIITPESLESILINRKAYTQKAFSALKYIVIDELHTFIGEERGQQLQSLMSRIEFISGDKKIPRIAMSATFSSYEKVEAFLRPGLDFPCKRPDCGKVEVKNDVKIIEYIEDEFLNPQIAIAKNIYNSLRGSNNLVFTNSRNEAENYTLALTRFSEANHVENQFRVHHGNLSKEVKESVEQELKLGKHPVTTFCTSTLELGIDIGQVNSVAQIGYCASVSSLRQRMGRSGRRGKPSVLRIHTFEKKGSLFKNLRYNLVLNTAVVELMNHDKYEEPCLASYHFSTLIQQLLSMLVQFGSFLPKEGWVYLCQNGAFKNVNEVLFVELLKALGKQNIIAMLHDHRIIIGLQGEKMVNKLDFYVAFKTSLVCNVYNIKTSREIGTYTRLPAVNDIIILSARRWLVKKVDKQRYRIEVEPVASGGRATLSGTQLFAFDKIIAKQMKQVYLSTEKYAFLDGKSQADQELEKGRIMFRKLHLEDHSFVTFGKQKLFATWAGGKINNTISLISILYLEKDVGGDGLFLIGLDKTDVMNILKHPKPEALQLAALIKRVDKVIQKYDGYLSDSLLDLEYAASYIDVDGAWDMLLQATD